MERNGYPVAAMVLGIVMGTMVEQSFVTSLIKSDGSILPFFSRPVAAVLAAMTIAALLWPVGVWLRGLLRRPSLLPNRGDERRSEKEREPREGSLKAKRSQAEVSV